MPDRKLYSRNPRTRRLNVSNLLQSGPFGRRRIIERSYYTGEVHCQCAKAEDNYIPSLGCYRITNFTLPNECDWLICPTEGTEFDQVVDVLGFPPPPSEYRDGYSGTATTPPPPC